MSETSYRYTISIPINQANADLIDKLKRMENGSRSRFTRAVMDDGFKYRDEKEIDRFYGVFFSDEAPAVAPAPKTKIKAAEKTEKAKVTPKRASEQQSKGTPPATDVAKLSKALDDSLML